MLTPVPRKSGKYATIGLFVHIMAAVHWGGRSSKHMTAATRHCVRGRCACYLRPAVHSHWHILASLNLPMSLLEIHLQPAKPLPGFAEALFAVILKTSTGI